MHCIILEQTSNFFHKGSARTRRRYYSSLARFVRVGRVGIEKEIWVWRKWKGTGEKEEGKERKNAVTFVS